MRLSPFHKSICASYCKYHMNDYALFNLVQLVQDFVKRTPCLCMRSQQGNVHVAMRDPFDCSSLGNHPKGTHSWNGWYTVGIICKGIKLKYFCRLHCILPYFTRYTILYYNVLYFHNTILYSAIQRCIVSNRILLY